MNQPVTVSVLILVCWCWRQKAEGMEHTKLVVPVESYLLLAAALEVLTFVCCFLQGF